MSVIFKFFLIFVCVFIPLVSKASDVCSKFKYNPDINVNNTTEYTPKIKFSNENMVGRMGEIVYQTSYSSKILLVQIPVKNGYCVSLRSVDIDINVPEFVINIDKRLKSSKCAYDIVLSHETDHMNVNKSVINDNIDDIKNAVKNAALSIKPVFISNIDDYSDVQKNIQKQIESFKNIEDIKQKIKKEINEKNEDIDTRGDSFDMWNCKDFYNEMKKFSDTITID